MKKYSGTSYLFLLSKITSLVLGSVLGFFFIGFMIDRWVNTPGYGMIAGVFIGLIIGFYATYRMVEKVSIIDNCDKEKGNCDDEKP